MKSNFLKPDRLNLNSVFLSLSVMLFTTIPTFAKLLQSPAVEADPEPLNLDITRLSVLSDSVATLLLENELIPGMSIALAKDGKILFTRAYGLADVEMNSPAKPETVFGISSITKQFTAAAIMKLVEQDKLSVEDPIELYLPDFPVQGQLIKVKHLLNHTSGIRDREIRSEADLQKLRLDISYEGLVDMTTEKPFIAVPGERYDYNNMGYTLLGQIIYVITGKTWFEYIENEFLKPLNLNGTYYGDPLQIIPNRSEGYVDRGGKLLNAPYISMKIAGPAGSLFSTVEDLVHWTHMFHNGKIVSPELVDQMVTPSVLESGDTIPYGYGFKLDKLEGYSKIYHGGTFGFGPYLSYYPEHGITIAVLTNSSKGREAAEILEEKLARLVLNKNILNLAVSPEVIAGYANQYTYKSGSRTMMIRVFGEDNQLWAQINGGKSFQLFNQGDHEFIPAINTKMRFIFSMKNSKATGFLIQEGWNNTKAIVKPNTE